MSFRYHHQGSATGWRPGPEIFDPGFFDQEKNLILNLEPGPDLKFSPETDPEFPNLSPDFQILNPETSPKPGSLPSPDHHSDSRKILDFQVFGKHLYFKIEYHFLQSTCLVI